jgi:polyhydroxybutyrate depolymerase
LPPKASDARVFGVPHPTRRRFGLALVSLTVLVGFTALTSGAEARSGAPDRAVAGGCGRPATPGVSTRMITVHEAQRSYLLEVPANLPDEPLPVIMGLHGGSDVAENAYRYMRLGNDRAALYVYPQAPYWPEVGGVAWNVDPGGVDFPYFDALLADLGTTHCVDRTRVFAAGKSNGGFMVNSLACFRPGLLRGIASVGGGGPQTSRCAAGVAAMIVHGATDRTVPIRSGQWSRDYWLARNADTGAAPVETKIPPCAGYPGSSKPVLWCQHPGAHTWPEWTGTGIVDFFLGL